MIRRINHTGRRKIARRDVRIVLREVGGRLTFDVTLDLGQYNFRPDAHVWLEAYQQGSASWMQFPWGRVSPLNPPTERWLDEFDSREGLLFRIRVTSDQEAHRIIAEADRVPCEYADGEQPTGSLLKIRQGDLGDEVWRLAIEENGVALVINHSVGDWKALSNSPEFVSLVFPAIIRAVLTQFLLVETEPPDEDAGDWRAQWLKLLRQISGQPEAPQEIEHRRIWIEDAAMAYARHYRLTERFNKEVHRRSTQNSP